MKQSLSLLMVENKRLFYENLSSLFTKPGRMVAAYGWSNMKTYLNDNLNSCIGKWLYMYQL